MIDRIFGDGACGVPGCTETTPIPRLLCHPHWQKIPPALREQVGLAWRQYRLNQISLDTLRDVQAAAIREAAK